MTGTLTRTPPHRKKNGKKNTGKKNGNKIKKLSLAKMSSSSSSVLLSSSSLRSLRRLIVLITTTSYGGPLIFSDIFWENIFGGNTLGENTYVNTYGPLFVLGQKIAVCTGGSTALADLLSEEDGCACVTKDGTCFDPVCPSG